MPELPEVETVRRGLLGLIVGRTIASVSHDTDKSFPNSQTDITSFLLGATILDVRRRAKVLMIDLSTQYTLVIHLKMTGQLVFIQEGPTLPLGSEVNSEPSLHPLKLARSARADAVPESIPYSNSQIPNSNEPEVRFGAGHPSDSLIGQLPDRSTRVIFEFTDESHLYFNDQRKFGWIRLLPSAEVVNIDFMQKVGPEPLEADFTVADFTARFARRPGTSIKAALLDQTVVAGIGNIYADESLWGAKIHPKRLVATLRPVEWKRLYTELRTVMNLAIEKGGSTDKNYVNAEGKRGSYLDFARVFRREGLPCPRCHTTIVKLRAAGRGTHICPHCQPEP